MDVVLSVEYFFRAGNLTAGTPESMRTDWRSMPVLQTLSELARNYPGRALGPTIPDTDGFVPVSANSSWFTSQFVPAPLGRRGNSAHRTAIECRSVSPSLPPSLPPSLRARSARSPVQPGPVGSLSAPAGAAGSARLCAPAHTLGDKSDGRRHCVRGRPR